MVCKLNEIYKQVRKRLKFFHPNHNFESTNGVFILATEVVSFLTIYLWSNNAAQDNQPLPSGYN